MRCFTAIPQKAGSIPRDTTVLKTLLSVLQRQKDFPGGIRNGESVIQVGRQKNLSLVFNSNHCGPIYNTVITRLSPVIATGKKTRMNAVGEENICLLPL